MTVLTDALLASLDESIADVAKASTLPAVLYTSPEVLRLRARRRCSPTSGCASAGPSGSPNPGDWFTVTFGDEPIIVARDKSGAINALSAVCQHRAMQVCDGAGNSTTFKCPYHHWTYGLDGRLLGAPAMERTADFDKSRVRACPGCRSRCGTGFVFVNLDPDAPPLAPTLARYEPYLDQLRPRRRGVSRHVHPHRTCRGTGR